MGDDAGSSGISIKEDTLDKTIGIPVVYPDKNRLDKNSIDNKNNNNEQIFDYDWVNEEE